VVKNLPEWYSWATKNEPHIEAFPAPWEEKLNGFEKLIVLKVFRPEKLLFAFQNYVIAEVGKFYVENPSATMEVVYADTDVKTPLIFVLSQGADPTS
jgi:dynein heavy chain